MASVSVIVPTFNRLSLLCRAIESVLQQNYSNIELIVVDDGSTDETQEVVPQRFPSVRYVRIKHSGLPAVARNAGIRYARGEYIAFLDSDDRWLPNKMFQQVDLLERRPSLGLVCSNAFVIDYDSEEPHRQYLRAHQGTNGCVLDALVKDNFVITSTAVVRRSVLEQVGVFCEEKRLRAVEDYDLWLRISAVCEVAYIPCILAVYRDMPSASIRGGLSQARHWQSRLLIIKRLRRFLTSQNNDCRALEELLASQALEFKRARAKALLAERRYFAAIPHLVALCANEPLTMGKAALRRIQSVSRIVPPNDAKLRRHSEQGASSDNLFKLHLGCGEIYLPGYINIDFPQSQHSVQRESKADVFADLSTLTYPEGTVDEIRLHHVFEHFERPIALRLLIEWYAWLKEGGRLIIETPDFHRCIQEYLRSAALSDQMKILRHLFGSHEAKWAVHCDGWDQGKFEHTLTALGYHDLECSVNEWRGTFNVTVTAKKSVPWKSKAEQVHAAESILAMSLVDDSPGENRMLQVWMAQIDGASMQSDRPALDRRSC